MQTLFIVWSVAIHVVAAVFAYYHQLARGQRDARASKILELEDAAKRAWAVFSDVKAELENKKLQLAASIGGHTADAATARKKIDDQHYAILGHQEHIKQLQQMVAQAKVAAPAKKKPAPKKTAKK